MTKRLYNVKIDFEVWYDRNFEIEADSTDEAEALARQLAREQTQHLIDIDLPVENDGDWTYGGEDYSTVYVDYEEIA